MADPDDIGPVQNWLRRWKRIFDSRDQLDRLTHRPRTDQLLRDLGRRLARPSNRFGKTTGSGLDAAVAKEAAALAPLIAYATAKLGDDQLYTELLTSEGVDVGALAAELRKPLDSRDSFSHLQCHLQDPRLQPKGVEAVARVACRADQEDLRLLVQLALGEHRAEELARLPRATVASVSWRRAFECLDAEAMRDTPGPDLILELVASLISDAPARPGQDDGPWQLETAAERYTDSEFTDPMGHVAFQLVHGLVRVESSDDLDGARAVVCEFVRVCLVNVLHRRSLRGLEVSSGVADALWAALDRHGWFSGVYPQEAQWRTPLSGAVFTAREATVRFAAGKAAALASRMVADSVARVLAAAFAGRAVVELASRSLHDRVRPVCRPAVAVACKCLRRLVAGHLGTEDLSAFANQWATALGAWSAKSSASNWQMTHGPGIASATDLMDEVRRAIVGTEELRTVAWLVQGFEPSAEPVEFAGITFADPSQYNFGQGTYPSVVSRGEPVLLGRVTVDARTTEQARVIGRARLERALDAMVFASTGDEEREGLDLRLRLGSTIIEEPTRGGWHGRSDEEPREPRRRGAHEVAAIAAAQEALLRKADGPLSELEGLVVNALPWYRRARWEQDPTRRLLAYWILIEGAFAAPDGQAFQAIARAARLHVTWESLHALRGFVATVAHFERLLSHDDQLVAEADLLLPEWRLPRTSMTNPGCLARLADQLSDASSLGALPNEIEDQVAFFLDAGDAVRTDLRHRRWEAEIILDRARDHRNKIVHESQLVGGEDLLLAVQLEQIAEDLLRKLVVGVLRPAPAETLADLLEWWDAPF
ncbi:MAG: hypothetical protein H6719_08940 [Sandaracinaceae bacterium]|nr:hypothetical protein [Sandaracinaceae bacterium]